MRLVSLIFLLVSLTGCDGFGSLSDTEYVNRAQDYLDEGKLQSAAIELKNALSKNPDNSQARWLLGKLYLDIGNNPGAEKELLKARGLGVNDESVLPLLARAYLAQKKYGDVQVLRAQSTFSKKVQASLLTSQGIAFLEQDNLSRANESIASAMRIKPDLPYVSYGQALSSVGSGDLEQARKALDSALKYNPGYAPAWDLLGDLERRANRPEPAEQAYSKAVENSFNDINPRFKRILMRIQLQKFDAAQQEIDQLKKRAPDLPVVNYSQGLLSFLQGNYPNAQESFERTLQVDENYMPAVFYLGATHYALENGQQAETYLSRFISANPGYMPARKLLAVQKLSQRDYQRVEELARPVVQSAGDDVLALNLLANALLSQGKTGEGIEMLERVSKLQPDSAEAKTRLGVGLLMKGEQSDAVASLESAIELDSEFQQADILLTLYYLRKNDFDQAQKAAQDFISRQPDSPVAYNLLGLTYMGKNQREKAEEAFTKAVEIAQGDPAASHNLAALALSDQKSDEARELYQQVLDRHEDHLDTLLKMANLEARQGDATAMKATLERAMLAHPDALQPRVLLARGYLRANDVDKASDVMGDLDEKYPDSPPVLAAMGEIQLAKQDYRAAKIVVNRLVERLPSSAQARYLLAQTYAGLNESEGFRRELEKAIELEPDYVLARILLARFFLSQKETAQANVQLEKLKSLDSNNTEIMALEARILAGAGRPEQALVVYENLFEIAPSTNTLLLLTNFQLAQGNIEAVIDQLQAWTNEQPGDIPVMLALANGYISANRIDDAIEQYRNVLKLSRDNLLALNNLAWYLHEKNPAQALSYAERAAELVPDSPRVLDTLAIILAANGDLERALRMSDRALNRQPDNPSLRYHRAQILMKSGLKMQAAEELRDLLGQKAEFRERSEAEQMLERLNRG